MSTAVYFYWSLGSIRFAKKIVDLFGFFLYMPYPQRFRSFRNKWQVSAHNSHPYHHLFQLYAESSTESQII